jgi:hypothetical protein
MVPVTLSSPLFCGSRRAKSMQIRIHYPAPRFFTLKVQCHEIFDFWLFHESVSPKPLGIPLWPYRFFSKICVDIRSSRCTTGVIDTGGVPWLANISANLRNNLKRSQWDTLGLGETDSRNKPEAKNLVTLSFYGSLCSHREYILPLSPCSRDRPGLAMPITINTKLKYFFITEISSEWIQKKYNEMEILYFCSRGKKGRKMKKERKIESGIW